VARGIAYVLSSSLWRTSTFRLSTLFGAVYALGMALLLALIYYQTAGYLTQRVDNALKREAEILQQSSPETILRRFREEGARDPLNSFGLFSLTGERVAGDTPRIPQGLLLDGQPRDVAGDASATPRRAIGERTSWGEILVVERDTSQLVELRRIIINALLASGAVIASLGLMSAIALSIRPLRRVRAMQTATEAIISGDFAARLPVDGGQDELDQLARLVNDMVDEIERLLVQARTVVKASLTNCARRSRDFERCSTMLLSRSTTIRLVVACWSNALPRSTPFWFDSGPFCGSPPWRPAVDRSGLSRFR
jgi:HAMP domain-containing protein/uncharacterized membrane protein YciS (DUF1049 family)